MLLATVGQHHRFLRSAHGQTFRNNPSSQQLLRICTGLQREQRAGVTSAQHTRRNFTLHRHRQLQQANHVGDHRAGTSQTLRQFGLRHIEFFQKLLVSSRLFQRIQLHTVNILQQRVAQHGTIVGFPHNRRNGLQTGFAGGAPTALTHDDLKTGIISGATHHNRLHEAEFVDGVHQFGECFLIKNLARLMRVWHNLADRNLLVACANILGRLRNVWFFLSLLGVLGGLRRGSARRGAGGSGSFRCLLILLPGLL